MKRRILRRGRLLTLIGCAIGVGSAVAAAGVLAGGSDIAPRLPDESGYAVRNASLAGGSYNDPQTGEAMVDVAFDAAWAESSDYPGRAECRVDVLDADGSAIGSTVFEFGSYVPAVRQTLPVAVSGSPHSAYVNCTRAVTPPADAGYVISDASISLGGASDDPTREPRLTFRANWTTDVPPLFQRCEAIITLEGGGATQAYVFELSVGDGEMATVILTPQFGGGKVEGVSCGGA